MTAGRRRLEYRGRIGAPIPTSAFEGFIAGRVLLRYERPLLQLMTSPRGESWLFSWLESDEDFDSDDPLTREVVHTWVAFRISEGRLSDLECDRISLRDAILAAEHQAYLVTGISALNPTQIRAVPAGQLPAVGLPVDSLTIHGKDGARTLTPAPLPRQIGLEFHLAADSISSGELPFSISGLFQDKFQRWAADSAHHAYDPSPRGVELTYRAGDWASISELAKSTGSFQISAVAEGEPFELDRLDESLSYLARLVARGKSGSSPHNLEKGIGRTGSFALFSLLHFVLLSKVSVGIKWTHGTSEHGITLNPEGARGIIDRFQGERRKIESKARLTVPLSQDDVTKLRLPVVGRGGLQDLMRALQGQLTDDGVLSVTPGQIERILRYSQSYGSGGFQGRLQGVLVELKRLSASLSTLR